MGLRDSLRTIGWTEELIASFLDVDSPEALTGAVDDPLLQVDETTTELVVSWKFPEMTSGANG